MNDFRKLLVWLVMWLAVTAPVTIGAQDKTLKDKEFKAVELDRFIEAEQRVVGPGKKLIKMAEPVSFEARMKRYPEAKKMTYVFTALEVAGVSPMPEVGHRMFLGTVEGRIIPVYVEKAAAAKLRSGLKEEERARFLGYHVYTYEKGPAILVVDFFPIAQ